jgi:glyoxylase-like metal-dependent hydrolase (beta-lactamase superfamily II)
MRKLKIEVAERITLDLIDLPLQDTGIRDFFGIWLIRDSVNDFTAIVDVGPASTVSLLIDELTELGVNRIDHILLSHIHLDHSGGLAQVLRAFPSSMVTVHPKGRRHLTDPEKLWESSLQVIPDMAAAYGKPLPVDENVFLDESEAIPGIRVLETPGHAPHHLSFLYNAGEERVLFAGEAASTYNSLDDLIPGSGKGKYLLRPASPPRFYLESALESIGKLRRQKATTLCYAHFGYTREVDRMLGEAKEQILLWQNIFLEYLSEHPGTEPGDDLGTLVSFVIDKDPWLSEFSRLPEETRKREMGFLLSSAAGFLGAVYPQPAAGIK